MKQDCGKPVCVEWYCSDLVGQIPTIVVLFKGKGCLSAHNNMLCLGINACPQNITVNYQIYCYYFFYFFISGILKCFLSSVAHLTALKLDIKKEKKPCPQPPFKLRAGHRSCCCHLKGKPPYEFMLGIFHKHKCKATYIEIGVLSGCQGYTCKFAIIFHTPQNLRNLELAGGFYCWHSYWY